MIVCIYVLALFGSLAVLGIFIVVHAMEREEQRREDSLREMRARLDAWRGKS